MPVTVVRRIVLETCSIIWKDLSCFYLSLPSTYGWKRIAEDFKNIWDMPNCVGAIDGKHVAIAYPQRSGSNCYNYKGTYSIILMALCDANYTFAVVDIGAYGSQSDGGLLNISKFGMFLRSANLNFPADTILSNSDVPTYPGLLLCEKKQNLNKRKWFCYRRIMETRNTIIT